MENQQKHPQPVTTPIQDLRSAVLFHGQGRLREAEQLYRAVLTVEPTHFDCLHNLGLVRAQQGDFAEAATFIGAAAEQRPTSVEAHTNFGNALALLNRHSEAVASYRRALALKPDYPEAHNNIGIELRELGRQEDAIEHFRKALDLNARFNPALNNLANALATLDRHHEAIPLYEKALAIAPNDPESHNNLGVSLAALNRAEEAIPHYRKALAGNPNYAEAHNNLGAALETLNRPADAIVCFEKAILQRPNYPEAHNNLGNALRGLNRHGEALACYRKAITIRPDFALAHGNVGDALRELGCAEEAQRAYQMAIELAPERASYYRRFGDTKRFTLDDPRFAAMRKLAQEQASLPREEQIELHFALAKAFGDVGLNDESFRHLLEGNALHRQRISYDEPATLAFFDRIRTVFTRELIQSKANLGASSDAPVFIVGMIRSGTTLVEQILASHPEVYGAGELTTLARTAARFRRSQSTTTMFPETFSDVTGEQLKQLSSEYLREISDLAPAAKRIIDKMPANFRLVGLIHLLLPNARVIHVQRDPVDTCLSCFSILFAGDQPFAYDLGELGRFYRAYEALMEHWRSVLPKDVMLEIRYEELIADTEHCARNILAHVALEWDDRCLAFHKSQRPVRTASTLQVRQPIYRTSIGRPKPDHDLLAPLLKGLQID